MSKPGTPTSRGPRSAFGLPFGLMTGVVALGAAAALARYRPFGHSHSVDRAAQLRSYLADHLTGSDAAFAVVKGVRESYVAAGDAELFERLYYEFAEERTILRAMMRALGGSPFKAKRLIGHAGSILQTGAGGKSGDLALFRTLESLAVGVQGKRCLWRAAQRLEPSLQSPTTKTFQALEMQATAQWEHIEQRRLALASRTFAADAASSSPWPISTE